MQFQLPVYGFGPDIGLQLQIETTTHDTEIIVSLLTDN